VKKVSLIASDEEVGTLRDPPVIKADMVRNEIQKEVNPSLLKAFTKPGELSVATDRRFRDVLAYRERRTADVVLRQVREDREVLLVPLRSLS
jgi:hypothetical protein